MKRQDGLAAAFDRLYIDEWDATVRLLTGITGDVAVAEELAQEAFVATYRHWAKVQSYDRPDLWLRRVAINRARSRLRRWSAERRANARLTAEVRAPDSPGEAQPDGELLSVLLELSDRQRAAIVLHALEGYTFVEIGRVLGVSPETARTHYRRAQAHLADRVGRLQGTSPTRPKPTEDDPGAAIVGP